MGVHRIQLRQPWSIESQAGGIVLRRTFHTPTGLSDRNQVWLVIQGLGPNLMVSVNDTELIGFSNGPEDGKEKDLWRADITSLLKPDRNRVLIHLPQASWQEFRETCHTEGLNAEARNSAAVQVPSFQVFLEILEL